MSQTIPFTSQPLSRRAIPEERGHEIRDPQSSGTWVCTLTTITPLCIRSVFSKLAPAGTQAYLPGSSLRGMVRNVAEMLGAGCARYYRGDDYPDELLPCTPESACLVCRVFGFVHGDSAWAGKVRFSDSERAEAAWVRHVLPRERPPHEEDKGPGWIIFPHTDCIARLARFGGEPCVPSDRSFRFRVDYLNLDAEQYAILKFALTLRHGETRLCHKLGYAKSLGLGSCRITIPNDQSPPIPENIHPYLEREPFKCFCRLRLTSRSHP